jgi:hypothetical protein
MVHKIAVATPHSLSLTVLFFQAETAPARLPCTTISCSALTCSTQRFYSQKISLGFPETAYLIICKDFS